MDTNVLSSREVDVKSGFELFNQIVFKYERLFLCISQNKVNVGNPLYEKSYKQPFVSRTLKVAPDTIFKGSSPSRHK